MAETPHRDIVLVVDDSPETLSFLTSALRGAKITVLVALDSEGALAVIERMTPDIILLDAVMPGMDGFETCRSLKRIQSVAHIPVIFMTGLTDTEHIIQGFAAGGVDYVTKPIVVEELMARIRVHLSNARLTQSARIAHDTAGRYLLAINAAGGVRWCTPQAGRLLAHAFPGFPSAQADPAGFHLPNGIVAWLQSVERADSRTATASFSLEGAEERFELSYLGRSGADEFLLRLIPGVTPGDDELLRQSLALTSREAEVLLWIARGKSNRNISDILRISPRTVDKHLEQIYTKLGVENRVSAATLAVRILGSRL